MSNILIAYFSHRGENYVAGSIVDLPDLQAGRLQFFVGELNFVQSRLYGDHRLDYSHVFHL